MKTSEDWGSTNFVLLFNFFEDLFPFLFSFLCLFLVDGDRKTWSRELGTGEQEWGWGRATGTNTGTGAGTGTGIGKKGGRGGLFLPL